MVNSNDTYKPRRIAALSSNDMIDWENPNVLSKWTHAGVMYNKKKKNNYLVTTNGPHGYYIDFDIEKEGSAYKYYILLTQMGRYFIEKRDVATNIVENTFSITPLPGYHPSCIAVSTSWVVVAWTFYSNSVYKWHILVLNKTTFACENIFLISEKNCISSSPPRLSMVSNNEFVTSRGFIARDVAPPPQYASFGYTDIYRYNVNGTLVWKFRNVNDKEFYPDLGTSHSICVKNVVTFRGTYIPTPSLLKGREPIVIKINASDGKITDMFPYENDTGQSSYLGLLPNSQYISSTRKDRVYEYYLFNDSVLGRLVCNLGGQKLYPVRVAKDSDEYLHVLTNGYFRPIIKFKVNQTIYYNVSGYSGTMYNGNYYQDGLLDGYPYYAKTLNGNKYYLWYNGIKNKKYYWRIGDTLDKIHIAEGGKKVTGGVNNVLPPDEMDWLDVLQVEKVVE